jgi:NADH dehydrogenase
VPGIAPAAKQMGQYVAEVIAARTAGRTPPGPFRYHHQGDLATIGRKAAVVRLASIHLKGFIGWLFWGFAHIYFLIGLRNRAVVAFSWLWNYLTYQRGARLIVDSAEAQTGAQAEKVRPSMSAVEVMRRPGRDQAPPSGTNWH